MRRGIFVKRISIETTWRACPQVFPGLQGHPSAGGHGGGYPDGEDCLSFISFSLQNISNRCFFSFFFPQVATDVIKEFAADGVKYLELRSTPREEKNTGKDVNVEVHILIARSELFEEIRFTSL